MRNVFEFVLIAAVAVVMVLGFWDIYVGASADPQPHHHLHLATTFVWLGLILFQFSQIATGNYATHRTVGLAVLGVAPLLVATTAMLSVHSAHKGVVSGEGDFLIVQNVMGTIELALLIFLAFLLRKRRALHGAFMLSTTLLFLGIALFFALIAFAPPFKIEGPETFYRFQTAAMTGQAICLAVGALFFVKDFRNGWPFLLPGLFFFLNDAIRSLLTAQGLIDPLTGFVGSLSQPLTFAVTFAVVLGLLTATGVTNRNPIRESA
jgi:hypothetical protein